MTEVIHIPLGQEHPYEQGPEERFPRHPLSGEPFTVGIVTRPPDVVKKVVVHSQLDDQSQTPVPAQRLDHWQPEFEHGVGVELLARRVHIEQDVWQAQLTAPPLGAKLTYWVEADGVKGPQHEMIGVAWQSAPASSEVHPLETGLWEMNIAPDGIACSTIGGLPDLQKVEWLTDGVKARRVRLTFNCPPDEAFFGLGERYNALNQRGQVMDVRCYEQYKTQGKRTYMPMPFLLSSNGYAVYVESARWMQFDLAASAPDRWTLDAELGPDEKLRLVWFQNSDPLEIIGRFSRLTGQPVLPPLWAFGLWMSANEWNSQKRVLHEVAQTELHEIDASVLVIEAWSDETTFYIWNDAAYQAVPGDQALSYSDFTFPPEGKWPNPQAMVDTLHEKDIHLILWQIPALKKIDAPHPQHDHDWAYFEQQGFGVREADGSLYKIRPFWFRNGYLWDVTNPAGIQWWLNKRAYLLDELGIDGFKTDGGEHLWGAATRFFDGRGGDELWNLYPLLYTKAYYEFANQKRNGDALLFSRAGFAGSQAFPAHWAGDENSTWEAFRASIVAGLSAGISGIPFWSWDIGGFSGELPSAELYLRGTAMATFCPIMQYHAEYNSHRVPSRDRTPWNMQEQTGHPRLIEIFRYFNNVRRNLMPYIWQEAQWSAETGQPMMRALRLWDTTQSDYAYYFGRDLLVYPVVQPDMSEMLIELPEGQWVDLWTHQPYQGGRSYVIATPVDSIPVFVRAGVKLPVVWGEHGTWGDRVPLTNTPTDRLEF
ncbi:MAG: hypothetical protein HY862_08000 [Chloroflexi bacterium]|nr:hypothetical protein [Chloroflexota bacterium]